MPRLFTIRHLLFIITVLAVYILISVIHRATWDDRWYAKPAPCIYSPSRIADTLTALRRAHSALQRSGLTHFLCYGSLWGALRSGALLPTDRAADLCVLDEQLVALGESHLYRLFRDVGLALSYDPTTGVYLAYYGASGASVSLTVFERSADGMWYQRVGIVSRLLPPQSKSRFPSRLVVTPLNRLSVRDVAADIPVPREDVEIQKYLYKDDWWKEVAPPGC